GTLV
ncbi:hypothetical protein CP8484711_0753B, partial [Chlamydia psittaci 84-8471/1]